MPSLKGEGLLPQPAKAHQSAAEHATVLSNKELAKAVRSGNGQGSHLIPNIYIEFPHGTRYEKFLIQQPYSKTSGLIMKSRKFWNRNNQGLQTQVKELKKDFDNKSDLLFSQRVEKPVPGINEGEITYKKYTKYQALVARGREREASIRNRILAGIGAAAVLTTVAYTSGDIQSNINLPAAANIPVVGVFLAPKVEYLDGSITCKAKPTKEIKLAKADNGDPFAATDRVLGENALKDTTYVEYVSHLNSEDRDQLLNEMAAKANDGHPIPTQKGATFIMNAKCKVS